MNQTDSEWLAGTTAEWETGENQQAYESKLKQLYTGTTLNQEQIAERMGWTKQKTNSIISRMIRRGELNKRPRGNA